MHAAEPLYAIGDFVTRGAAHDAFNLDATQTALIREWKSDYADLLQRFDHDRDGALNDQEWQQVRDSAKVQAQALHRARSSEPAQYYLRKPQEKQPFVLSSYAEDVIAKRFNRQAILGALICIACALGAAYLINTQLLIS